MFFIQVSDIFTVPITHFLHPSNQGYTRFRNGWVFPTFPNCKHQVWGMTAVMTETLLSNAFSDFYKAKLRLPKKNQNLQEMWLWWIWIWSQKRGLFYSLNRLYNLLYYFVNFKVWNFSKLTLILYNFVI